MVPDHSVCLPSALESPTAVSKTSTQTRIADYTAADSSFMDVIKAVKSASNRAGSSTDPRIQTVYVDTSQWISFARTALQQPRFGGIMIPTFFDLQEGIDFARREINRAQTQLSA